MHKNIWVWVFCALWFSADGLAQFSGNILAEYQYGGLPTDASSFSAFYNRLVTNYKHKGFKASGSLEVFQSPRNGSSYVNLSQLSLRYKQKTFDIRVGNFYETIGRGTLLRSFEIPGAVLEDLSYRSRHYFNRDIQGAIAKFRFQNFETKLIYGKPLNYVFPPTQHRNQRRADEISAIYSAFHKKQQTLGFAFMNHKNASKITQYFMTTLSGSISPSLTYYTEVSKNISDFDVSDFSNRASFAAYAGLSYTYKSLGLSVEYKNYKNFLIGSGINEPPALVKEHSYSVLNRSTHVLQPANENGYQLEAFYSFPDFSTITLNYTKEINDFNTKTVFEEYFVEYDFTFASKHDVKIFADYAKDPFKLEDNRISTGINTVLKATKTHAYTIDYEFQSFERLAETYQNHVMVLGYNPIPKLIGSVVAEWSTDSFLVEEGTRFWAGINMRYQVNRKNSLQLFIGERRGGPACNAGVCYEVLDFKGVELRFSSRF